MKPADVEAMLRSLAARLERVEAKFDHPVLVKLLDPMLLAGPAGDDDGIPYEHDEDTVYQTYPDGVRAVSYDFLGPGEASAIATLLNRGVGPGWDELKPELEEFMRGKKGEPTTRRYTVVETCQATVATTYVVEAGSEDEAIRLIKSGEVESESDEVYGHQSAEYEIDGKLYEGESE